MAMGMNSPRLNINKPKSSTYVDPPYSFDITTADLPCQLGYDDNGNEVKLTTQEYTKYYTIEIDLTKKAEYFSKLKLILEYCKNPETLPFLSYLPLPMAGDTSMSLPISMEHTDRIRNVIYKLLKSASDNGSWTSDEVYLANVIANSIIVDVDLVKIYIVNVTMLSRMLKIFNDSTLDLQVKL